MDRISKKYIYKLLLIILLLASVAFAMPQIARADTLVLNVSYGEIKCGEPTVFTLSGPVENGNYQYRLSDGYLKRGVNAWDEIVDPSQTSKAPLKFSTDNTIEFSFYASGTYILYFYIMDMNTYQTARKTVTLTVNDPDYPDIETVADGVAAECLKTCTTDYEKALWLHDWLLDNVTYSLIYCSAEGGLVRGMGSCNAYHNAYIMLLNRVGVQCGESLGNGHIWTAVKMDGEWYQVDVTWDDPVYSNPSFVNYLYFGLTDEMMQTVHSEHQINANQRSTHYEDNYFIHSGAISQWSDPMAVKIQAELDKGETEFTVSAHEAQPLAYRKIYYNLSAWELSNREWTSGGKSYSLSVSYEGLENVSAANNNQMHVVATLLDDITYKDGVWKVRSGLIESESKVIIAEYNKKGKILSTTVFTVTPENTASQRGEYSMDENRKYSIFLIDGNGKPLCGAWSSV